MSNTLTDDDRALLARPLHGYLTVAPFEGRWPAPRPVWFEVTETGEVQLFSGADSPKVNRLRVQPTASLVVAAPPGEPERWVAVTGRVVVHDDGARELCTRLAGQYWDLDDPAHAADLAGFQAAELVRVVIQPATIARSGS